MMIINGLPTAYTADGVLMVQLPLLTSAQTGDTNAEAAWSEGDERYEPAPQEGRSTTLREWVSGWSSMYDVRDN